MKKALLALALISNCAFAQLIPVSGNDKIDVLLDKSTLHKTNAGYHRTWLLYNYANPRALGGNPNKMYSSMRAYVEFDCGERRYRMLSISMYSNKDAAGDTLVSVSGSEWAYYAPDTIIGGVAGYVCH